MCSDIPVWERVCVGAAIGRPPTTVSANQEIANGAEDRNNPLVQKDRVVTDCSCGRAMRAPTLSYVPCRMGIDMKKA